MKKMIQKIRAAKSWRDRVEIAQDKIPGTAYDYVFKEAQLAKSMWNAYRPASKQIHEALGEGFAQIIQKGQAQRLHEIAAALAVWKRHKPKPNFELVALFHMTGLYPPGWEKTFGRDSSGKLVPGYTPISRGVRVTIAMRDIKEILAQMDPNFREENWESRRRKIQRYAREFKIPLDDTPGSPTKKTRQKPGWKI